MKLQNIKTTSSNSLTAFELQASVSAYVNQINLNPFIKGSFLSTIKDEDPTSATYGKEIPITLGTTVIKIAHRLTVRPQGYIITSQNADARIWRVDYPAVVDSSEIEKQKRDAALFINLKASATVTVTLWVF